ncbi:zinc finger and BTB domain-containing protein 41-like isoform X2 [Sinocyclocheilus anshuiensis]|uniref:Zinc finger and BTB domain-containing protein 41-like n=2 Tax=Sinocyclocheilus anshuiensis TaxID=1608454 RepID=A0A671PWR5_9TELE|nr:PREDICTED: zinc finger and BTB domain-containing protein 41-like isoform X2 [Sinocyclocheilus anshuiensis]XP_016356267.1 PREDICTED: zinc finger and BTB domain-containing protein 41-like isoform X2 [Sinocyclocheilus anshuiensis]XP_016356269.1 PREDICTED: zinc finger and BTB domain-containing protein 41-like isoform X2 [Sinocyclocheilus anshuiensis]
MSEFTLDIQLTELGFSNWNFPLCEPQSVKENFLPTQNGTEKPAPETETPTDCHEDACIVASSSADKSFLQDHQYYTPFKDDSSSNGETAQSNSKISSKEKKDKVICNLWKRGRGRGRRREGPEQRNDDDEEQNGKEGMKNNDKEQKCSEVSQEASGLTIDDAVSGEEMTDEDAEFVLTDDDDDDDVEEVEEDEEDDVVEDKEEEEEEDDDDVSWSETNGSGENEENRCHVCDLTFSSLFLLREHLNMHTGVRPYRCDECGKQFCQLVNYRTHLRSHSQKASIHCRVCSTIFETEEQLQQHLDTNHFEKEFYQCDFCKQIFTDLDVCKGHVEAHRQQAKRHLCLKCGASFRLRNSLLRHLEWHSRGIFSCSDCERTFSSKASLLRHSFSHLGILPYTCLKCKRHFRLPSLYHNHECKPENIQCMACLVFFQSQEDFDKHKKDTGCWGHQGALPTKTDEIRCMECGQVFASIEELKKHGSTHQRILKCAECGMGFRSSLMLMSHMGGHAGQRPCFCQDCGLGFPHQQGYDSHLKTCGVVTPPVAAVKKPKPKATPSPQIIKPITPNIIIQTVAQASAPATFPSSLKEVHMVPFGDKNKPADGRWKFTLNKEPPPGMPLVMLLPVPTTQFSTTSVPTKSSQNLLPSSLVLETPSSAPRVVSMQVVPSGTVISKEVEVEKDTVEPSRTNIPSNTLIPLQSHDSISQKRWTVLEDQGSVQMFATENVKAGEQAAGVAVANQGTNVTAQVEVENKQETQSNLKPNAPSDEKTVPGSSSENASLNPTCPKTPLCLIKLKEEKDGGDNIKKSSSNLKDLDSSPVMAGVEVLKRKLEKQTLDSSQTGSHDLVSCSSEMTYHKKATKDERLFKEVVSSDRMCAESQMEFTVTGDKSENCLQGQNQSGFDVEVEINEDVESSSMEVEIGDEDSGVDMLEGELHECVTCGQVLPEKDMIQHYMKHAADTDSTELSPDNCASHTTEPSSPCSPSRKRLRSGTEL